MNILPTPHEGPTTGEPAPAFQKKIGLFDGTMLVVGTIIGSGIFIVSAEISRDVGSAGWLMAVWVLTGVMTVMGALCYAELAAMIPKAGGQYIFLRDAYTPLWGFMYGWACFLVIQTGSIAAVGVAFAKFLGVLVPALGVDPDSGAWIIYQIKGLDWKIPLPLPWSDQPLIIFERKAFTVTAGHAVAVVIVAFLSLVNCAGVQQGKLVQNVFTIAKTAGLIVLIVAGLTIAANSQAVTANWSQPWDGAAETYQFDKVQQMMKGLAPLLIILMVLGGAMVGSLFASDAWNNLTFTAGEIRNPRRNLPLSLFLGVTIVTALYLVANLAYTTALPVRAAPKLDSQIRDLKKEIDQLKAAGQLTEAEAKQKQMDDLLQGATTQERGIAYARDDRVGTAVMEQASPNLGVKFIALAVMISTFGSINGMILMGARLYWAMAADNLFFHRVGRLNRRGVPAAGLILQGLWSILLIFSGTYSELLDYVIFAALLFYVLTVIGLFVLRKKMPNAERPYRVWGYPVLPIVYVILCAAIMLDLLFVKPVFAWPGLIIVLTGIPVYFLWRLRARYAS